LSHRVTSHFMIVRHGLSLPSPRRNPAHCKNKLRH